MTRKVLPILVLFAAAAAAQTTTPVAILHVLAEDSAVFANLPDKPSLLPQVTLLLKPNDPAVERVQLKFQGGNLDGTMYEWPLAGMTASKGWYTYATQVVPTAPATVPGQFTATVVMLKPTGPPLTVQVVQ